MIMKIKWDKWYINFINYKELQILVIIKADTMAKGNLRTQGTLQLY